MTKAELQNELAKQRARIVELDEQKEQLLEECYSSEWDNDKYRIEIGLCFAALCAALDAHLSIRKLPIARCAIRYRRPDRTARCRPRC